jgi:hypothetical protein
VNGTRIPPDLVRFARLWEEGDFWHCHEVLETPWRRNGSGFYKGLILLASAWVHHERGNVRGVRAQLRKALAVLDPYRPVYLGVDVERVVAHASATLEITAEGSEDTGDSGWIRRIAPSSMPLDPSLIRGDEPELVDPGE